MVGICDASIDIIVVLVLLVWVFVELVIEMVTIKNEKVSLLCCSIVTTCMFVKLEKATIFLV